MKRMIVLAMGLAVALSAPAMAGTISRQPYTNMQAGPMIHSTTQGGIVNGNGGIVYGSGFTVTHSQTGVYGISFSGTFHKCPLIDALPAGGANVIPQLYYYNCSNGSVQITILMENTSGTLTDNAFHFTAVQP